MTVKTPPPSHSDGYPAASTLTKDRPSGSWLLANNPTLAFASFLSNSSNDQSILSAKPTPLNSSYTNIPARSVMTRSSSTSQRVHRRNNTSQKFPQQQPGRSISFDAEFPTLTSISSTSTPITTDTSSSSTTSSTHQHVWNNAQRIQHKVKSPAKALWHGEDSDNEDEDNMMEIERLKALVPRRHSHQQADYTMTANSPPACVHRRRISSTSTSKTPATLSRKPHLPKHWIVTDRSTTKTAIATIKTTATSKQEDDASSSSSSSSSCSSTLSPPAPLSPTNTSSSATIEPASSSRHLNDDVVVTKRDQLRFYLFLKKWTGNLICDNVDPNGWQQQQQHKLSGPLPIGTQRYNSYSTSFYG